MISFLVITYNEEKHISRCIDSISKLSDDIVIVDSHSTDKTRSIAREKGARVYSNTWVNHSYQINWSIDNVDFKYDFVFRIDADEYLTSELISEIRMLFSRGVPHNVNGFNIKRRTYFLGRWMKHGGYYPTILLRLWRKGTARCEDREMDEHMVLSKGDMIQLEHDFIDHNLSSLKSWIDKHNVYSDKELSEYSKLSDRDLQSSGEVNLGAAKKKRKLKERYYSFPIFFRALIMFVYRYIYKCGFLDGKEGLIFYVLQTFWYRFLIDSKIYEREKNNVQ